jgi:hypothetical protein
MRWLLNTGSTIGRRLVYPSAGNTQKISTARVEALSTYPKTKKLSYSLHRRPISLSTVSLVHSLHNPDNALSSSAFFVPILSNPTTTA